MRTTLPAQSSGLVLWVCGLLLATPFSLFGANACIDSYPKKAVEVMTDDVGKLVSVVRDELLSSKNVYRFSLESGDTIMVRSIGDVLPPIGSILQLRVFFAANSSMPFASCYCRSDGKYCVVEYV